MMRLIAIALGVCLAGQAWGQNALFYLDDHGFHGNWDAVRECADKPFPAIHSDISKDDPLGVMVEKAAKRKEAETAYYQILLCRYLLIGRRAGWAEATDKPDPVPLVPLFRPGDFGLPTSPAPAPDR